MRRENKKRNKIIIGLISLLLIMTVGYAAFQTNLNIKGTSKISSNWDIRITNVTSGNKTGNAENAKTPTWTNLTASMEANLYEKGDAMEYKVTVENKGTFDAKLENILTNIKSNNEAIKISFSGYTKGEKLYKNTTKTVNVKIEYNKDYEGTPPSITRSGYNIIGYNTATGSTTNNSSYNASSKVLTLTSSNNNSTWYAITSKTITITFNKNGASSQTNGSGTAVSDTTVTRTCSMYNTSTTCNVTSPTIVGASGFSVVGYNTATGSTTSAWNHNTAKAVSVNTTYYAVTKSTSAYTATFNANGATSVGSSSLSCYRYNGSSSCTVTAPSITRSGFTITGWNTSASATTSSLNVGATLTLTSNPTYYAITKKVVIVTFNKGANVSAVGAASGTCTIQNTATNYNIKVRVTSGVSRQNTSSIVATTTNTIPTPTYSASYASGKTTVTITYPSGCGSSYTCSYIKDGGTAVNVTSTTAAVAFTVNGTLVAKVSDGVSTVSTSTYRVVVKYGISKGTVKGGSINVSTTLATHTENVSFTTSPSSDFTYQGATIVCNDGSKYNLNSNTKSFNITNTACTTATVYPSWGKNDYNIWYTGSANNTGGMNSYLYDGVKMNITWNEGGNRALGFYYGAATEARAQASTVNSFNITDYATFKANIWCYNYSGTWFAYFMGISQNKNSWVHFSPQVSNRIDWTNTASPANSPTLNISNYSGNYYISSQLYAKTSNGSGFGCYNDVMSLLGKTYSYSNQS
ncbi:MAG: InlB B-repeat-containing protein [Bacilli bacterium]